MTNRPAPSLRRCARRSRCTPPIFAATDQAGWPALQGPHNAQNIAIALAVAEALGLDAQRRPARRWPPMPACRTGWSGPPSIAVCSTSTTARRPIPASTAPALAAFPRIHWIVGGLPKGDNLDECAAHFGHVVHAYTIGEAGPVFADQLEQVMPVTRVRDAGERGAQRDGRMPRPAKWCCCRPPAHRSTSSAISKRAAIASARSSMR